MIIWGSKVKEDQVAQGQFFCPGCATDASYKRIKVAKYFTLYFIPLFPTESFGEYVRCGSCRGDYKPGVLSHSREQIMAAISPWACACGNSNAPGSETCVSCNASRAEPVAA
jgi:hypothetical protein